MAAINQQIVFLQNEKIYANNEIKIQLSEFEKRLELIDREHNEWVSVMEIFFTVLTILLAILGFISYKQIIQTHEAATKQLKEIDKILDQYKVGEQVVTEIKSKINALIVGTTASANVSQNYDNILSECKNVMKSFGLQASTYYSVAQALKWSQQNPQLAKLFAKQYVLFEPENVNAWNIYLEILSMPGVSDNAEIVETYFAYQKIKSNEIAQINKSDCLLRIGIAMYWQNLIDKALLIFQHLDSINSSNTKVQLYYARTLKKIADNINPKDNDAESKLEHKKAIYIRAFERIEKAFAQKYDNFSIENDPNAYDDYMNLSMQTDEKPFTRTRLILNNAKAKFENQGDNEMIQNYIVKWNSESEYLDYLCDS